MSSTTLPTTNQLELRPLSRTQSLKSMQPHSENGTSSTTELISFSRRKRLLLVQTRNPVTFKREKRDLKINNLRKTSKNNSNLKDFLHVFHPDQDNLEELMVTSSKEKNLSSTLENSNPRRNENISYDIFSFLKQTTR